MTFAALVAGQSMVFGLAVSMSPPIGATRLAIHGALMVSAIAVFALTGGPLLREAWNGLRQGRIVLEQFFLLGIFGAFGASVHSTITGVGNIYYEVVAVLLAIYTFGKFILARQRRDVLQAAGILGEEFDRCEIVQPDGRRREVPAGEVRKGDLVFVQQGGAISVDGIVREGVAFVRQTALTGEAFPAVKRIGDAVLAGSFSLDGALTVEAQTTGHNRRLDSLLAAVREGQSGAGPLQRNADRLVAWFLPLVLVASALTFFYWTMRAGWTHGMFNALAVLVVACPCSLGLAMPIGIWSALADMTRRGLIAHDGSVVERLAGVDAVVFDKTGTLSEEEFQLVDFVADGDRETLRQSVAAIEAASSHPVACAFRQSGVLPHAENVRLLPGIGIEGCVDGAKFVIGNDAVLDERNRARAAELSATLKNADGACRMIYVLADGVVVGVAMLREQLRDSAREALAGLSAMGVRCLILTGDSTAGAAAHRFDAETESELSPEEKVRRVLELKAEGHRVLFVGDGINDASAMLHADIGIAVHTGSALARDAAVMELAGGDLRAVVFAIERSKKAMRTMRGNFAFAIGYNVFGISLAAAGIIHPVLAAFLMMASSFTVTWRALRSSRKSSVPEAGLLQGRAMKFPVVLSCAACALFFAACSTTPQGPAPGTPAYFQVLESKNVAPATLQRVETGRVLSFADVLELVKCGVPDTEIVAYLKSTRAPYNYTLKQLNTLTDAGAGSTLYNYLGREEGDFMIDAQDAQQQQNLRNNAKFEKEMWQNPYFIDPDFVGAAPFPYMYPAGWY